MSILWEMTWDLCTGIITESNYQSRKQRDLMKSRTDKKETSDFDKLRTLKGVQFTKL
jgi:hypothetical protein